MNTTLTINIRVINSDRQKASPVTVVHQKGEKV